METIRPGIYHHFKSSETLYQVLGCALHTETNEELVVYKRLMDGHYFARPVDMFLEQVDKPDHHYMGPRFVYVRDAF
jgi:hypothetical protein